MFEIEKDNAKIGKHLEKLILSKHRVFGSFAGNTLSFQRVITTKQKRIITIKKKTKKNWIIWQPECRRL